MNEALVTAALATVTRDAMRRNPPPLRDGCEHDIAALPVIDFRVDHACRKCGGWA
jgi:hypothetical protein